MPALRNPGERRRSWAGGGRARGKGLDERERRRGRWGKREKGGRKGATGELRISRDLKVGRGVV